MAKKDVYVPTRCMASGILLGRMASALASCERSLESKASWSPAYAVHHSAGSAYKAAVQIERLQTTARPQILDFRKKLEAYKDFGSAFGFNKDQAAVDITAAKADLESIAQVVAKTCGSKRRPEEGEGAALLRMKRIKRERPPRAPKELMEIPAVPEETPTSSSSAWPYVAGVAALIGAVFLVG